MEVAVPDALSLGRGAGGCVAWTGESDSHEQAWAAGFFDGEGSTTIHARRGALRVTVTQAERSTLERFHAAVGGRGRITGGEPDRWHKRPIWKWTASGRYEVQAVLSTLWPYLSGPKRRQAALCFAAYRAVPVARSCRGPVGEPAMTRERRARQVEDRVLAALTGVVRTQPEVFVAARGDRAVTLGALKRLVSEGNAVRSGKGCRNDPYKYSVQRHEEEEVSDG